MISLVRNSSNSLLGGGRFSRFIGRTLRVRNCKSLLLIALLVGAAGNLAASGFFTINAAGDRVQLASENLIVGAREHFQWSELATVMPSGQRVLTQAEWYYLFQDRTNAYSLYALATVNGEQGLVILPDYDTWVLPAGLAFDYYHTGDGYGKNNYDAAAWDQMEAAGAVFLPCRGYSTDGTTAIDATIHGVYWTSTEYADGDPYYILFDDQYFYADKHNSKADNVYRCIRAAQPAVLLSENDEQAAFEAKKAALSSGTTADIQRTLRKAGCFNTLTLPFNVPDIEDSPLAGAEVYTFSGATVEGGTLRLDITPLVSSALTAGTPYLIQWPNTGEVISLMHFEGITWDGDNDADDAGVGAVTFHGFYGKTHISDETHGADHLHLFLGGNNQLYWPTDGGDATAKMLGFRAWFQISAPAGSQIRRGMPATLHISGSTTDLENVQKNDVQCTKELLNGQLIIIRNGEKYTLNGQKL